MSRKSKRTYRRSWRGPQDGPPPAIIPAAKPRSNSPDSGDMNRRRFLEAAGYSLSLTAVTGCTPAPVQIALPLVEQPERLIPGRSLHFATTCGGCPAGCGVLARVRDGRPLKMEGLPEHPLSQGGLCAIGQALPLGLYDSQRLRRPLANGKPSNWETVDREIADALGKIASEGGRVRFVTGTITSPALLASIKRFLDRFENAEHIQWDAVSSSAILDAHAQTHGQRLLPRYHFDRAQVIVSFGADFLGTWISPVEFAAAWRRQRVPTPQNSAMSYHVQLEGCLSLTGGKADRRLRLHPAEYGLVLSQLFAAIAQRAGVAIADNPPVNSPLDPAQLAELADRLCAARGHSLVVSDSQEVPVQTLVNGVNHLLGNYGATLDIVRPSRQRQANDAALLRLLEELDAGSVAALFVLGNELTHNLPRREALAEKVRQTPLVVSFGEREDDFAAHARYVCPDHHALESWGDAEPVAGVLTLSQPLIAPLGNTRSVVESLAQWSGEPSTAAALVRSYWEREIFPRTGKAAFPAFWDQAVHDGVVSLPAVEATVGEFNIAAVRMVARAPEPAAFTLLLRSRIGLTDSRHAHNPWLQELPDPITKVTWGNWASFSPGAAEKLGITDGDVVRITAADGGESIELPALIQPGQHDQVVAVPLGYGVRGSDRFAKIGPQWLEARPTVLPGETVGKNAASLIEVRDGAFHYDHAGVTITRAGRHQPLATTQEHHRLEVPQHVAPPGAARREPIQETTLSEFARDPAAGAPDHHHHGNLPLWPEDHPLPGQAWGMVIDLNACTGCSACVIACQAENNVPVVGKDEVVRQREMHWLRLDRYYSGDGDEVDVAQQPMMCQHCGNAPCETVCPVLATVHSHEGLNEQVYNRCVGTRYCANNCPYKVRRFNWFDYSREDALPNLALNPDVTVRSRGVMEKCSLCVHRVAEGKLESRRLGESLADGAVRTACQQSCPAQAIVFGDMNDPRSAIRKLLDSPRRFGVLEEFNFRPVVSYLRMVRNRPGESAGKPDEESEGKRHE